MRNVIFKSMFRFDYGLLIVFDRWSCFQQRINIIMAYMTLLCSSEEEFSETKLMEFVIDCIPAITYNSLNQLQNTIYMDCPVGF